MTKLLATSWEGYRQMVVPPNASAIQVQETRQAFYGGATVIMTLIMGSLGKDEEATEAELKVLEDLDAEIREFGAEFDTRHLPPANRRPA